MCIERIIFIIFKALDVFKYGSDLKSIHEILLLTEIAKCRV